MRRHGERKMDKAVIAAGRFDLVILAGNVDAGAADLGARLARVGLPLAEVPPGDAAAGPPGSFLEAVRRRGILPDRAAVIAGSVASVSVACSAGFGLVIGIDRAGAGEDLIDHGADVVVSDLAQIEVRDLACALSDFAAIARVLGVGPVGIFLDYDGTLTPIVERPQDARLSPAMRDRLDRLARYFPVAIVSGRDVETIRRLVGLDGLTYAGEHGFDIALADGRRIVPEGRETAAPAIESIAEALTARLADINGVLLERKRFSLAVHYRRVAAAHVDHVRQTVRDAAAQHPEVRVLSGKRVEEVQPRTDWDKGKAVDWLRQTWLPAGATVLFVGDDTTDEDVFRRLRDGDVGILVRDQPRPTAARFRLDGVAQVAAFLDRLTELTPTTTTSAIPSARSPQAGD